MKRFTILSLCVMALCMGMVGVACADPHIVEAWGLDFWNSAKLERELEECRKLDLQLTANQNLTRSRIDYRANLIADLVAQRATLEQTLKEFEELNRDSPPPIEVHFMLFKTTSERCVAAHQLLLHLSSRARDDDRFIALTRKVEQRIRTEFPK